MPQIQADPSSSLKRRLNKPVSRMSVEEKKRLLEEIREMERDTMERIEQAKAADPFWFFEPSDGTVTPEGMALLRRHLKEEDIPQRFDGQLDVFKSESHMVGESGGNQAGKSLVMTIRRLILATGAIPNALKGIFPEHIILKKRPRHYRTVGVDLINGLEKNVIPKYKEWVPRDYLIDRSWEKSFAAKSNTLTLIDPKDKGLISTIEFMSNKADEMSHQGPPMDGIDFDEEPDYRIYKENLVRLVTALRMDMQFGWTPTGGLSWSYHVLCNKANDDHGNKIQWFKLSSVTNKRANLSIVEEILKDITSYQEKKMRILGDYVSLTGLIYGNLFDPQIHLIEPFPINYQDFVVYRGLDPHTSKPTVCVESAFDREGNEYVCGLYQRAADTEDIKADLARRAQERNYRLGWTRCDRSANSTNHALGDRNIYLELKRGKNAIPALFESQKFTGSIHAGVDVIKQRLKINPLTGKPSLFIFNTPEMKPLIQAFRTMERDTYQNEEKKGMKDKINEGPHDAHAAFRYIHQSVTNWFPAVQYTPEYEPVSEVTGY